MQESKEIKALLHLIDDPDEEVFTTVSNRIITYGRGIIPNLEYLWENTLQNTIQERIEMLIHRLHYRDLTEDFQRWKTSSYHDLLTASLLVSKFQYPDLATSPVLEEIEKLRRNIWLELNSYLTPLEQVNVLTSIIYGYYNLKGTEVGYQHPDEFLIHKLIETKRGNAFVNGIVYLLLTHARIPPREAWWPLVGTTVGVVFGWPLLNTIALETAPSSHAAVVNGILPFVTAVIGATLNREHLSRKFWLCALSATTLVIAYAWIRAAGSLHPADALMLVGVLLGGLGYACGALAAKHATGPEVISWALIIALPATIALTAMNLPADRSVVPLQSWLAFAYIGLMSQWIGFFFWYRGLILGGIAKVSQVQLMQLFLTLGFSSLLLGESIEPPMIVVAILTLTLIFVGRRARAR